jgi:hypothetical protein
MGRHLEAVHETGHLELALNASQTALAAAEMEGSATRAQLVDSDVRVAGKISRRTPSPSIVLALPLSF